MDGRARPKWAWARMRWLENAFVERTWGAVLGFVTLIACHSQFGRMNP